MWTSLKTHSTSVGDKERVRGAAYDELIDTFVSAARERWPHAVLLLQDFAIGIWDRYRLQLCSFNDDIQGTAAVAVLVHC